MTSPARTGLRAMAAGGAKAMVAGAAVAGLAALAVPGVASAADAPAPPAPSAPTMMAQAVGDTVFVGEMIPADNPAGNGCLVGLYPAGLDLAKATADEMASAKAWPESWEAQLKQTSQLRTYVITGVAPGDYTLASWCDYGKTATQKVTITKSPAVGQIAVPLAQQFGSS
ncbi:hypothetical protein G4X40_04405 [Rhodococcus sp. D2-41]|uniref:Uncharacterized protein n=1 Tax=Speluncibacter jeojiensis TaxID=2710754 RepID=A0A9X4RFR8_9ACTN|nr:hypothetical protein [Rhodococcus sp. D2-41]MDG3009385.1 hypothetical protein [Rhodococcus sp. D2-41]MDG3016988.1 hypothetical protein [Corynebacteriales bacterium D3-21]